MKAAEYWDFEYARICHADAAVSGQLLPSPQNTEFIKRVQLDSWRQGMTDAADLAEHGRSYDAAKYIREKRDATQSL